MIEDVLTIRAARGPSDAQILVDKPKQTSLRKISTFLAKSTINGPFSIAFNSYVSLPEGTILSPGVKSWQCCFVVADQRVPCRTACSLDFLIVYVEQKEGNLP